MSALPRLTRQELLVLTCILGLLLLGWLTKAWRDSHRDAPVSTEAARPK
jgi:hypothetical protein